MELWKTILSLVHPNTDVSLACDIDCYFSKNCDGKEYLQKYINRYPKKWL